MRQALLVCFVFSALTLGCKKSDGSNNGGGDASTVSDAPPLSGDVYSLTWGPKSVPAGDPKLSEDTECITVRLNNDAPIKVHQLHNLLATTSHHLIIYKDDDPAAVENTTPTHCTGFTGALNPSGNIAPLAITQKDDDEVTLPDGVGYTLAAHQMIKIELHYINTTDATADAKATVNFYAADPATITNEAGVLFSGSLDINIPAQGQATLHQFLTLPTADLDMSASKIFAITGHTHKLGTQVTVGTADSRTGTVTTVYNPMPFSWSEPLTTTYATPFSVPAGGGFDFQCNWTNTTNATVKFGESANQEMCFFWVYYYPAQTPKVCAHTQQIGGQNGTDLCCPSSDAYCALVGNALGSGN